MTAMTFITICWADEDLVELRIKGSNGKFTAEVDVYADHEATARLANVLRGFPSGAMDTRTFEFGAVEMASAGGGVRLRFFCLDGSGHIAVELRFRSESRGVERPPETAAFVIPVEAASIDTFVERLEQMELRVGVSAQLELADHKHEIEVAEEELLAAINDLRQLRGESPLVSLGEPPFCSFCGASKSEAGAMVAGAGANICGDCVTEAQRMLRMPQNRQPTSPA
jgi:hypothetical protein